MGPATRVVEGAPSVQNVPGPPISGHERSRNLQAWTGLLLHVGGAPGGAANLPDKLAAVTRAGGDRVTVPFFETRREGYAALVAGRVRPHVTQEPLTSEACPRTWPTERSVRRIKPMEKLLRLYVRSDEQALISDGGLGSKSIGHKGRT